MNTRTPYLLAALLTLPVTGHGQEASKPPATDAVKIHIAPGKSGKIALEARHAPLRAVIDALSEKGGTQIHYNKLPEEFLSSNCSGLGTREVLTCILGPGANLAEKQADEVSPASTGTVKATSKPPKTTGKPAELWILDSSFTNTASRDAEGDAATCSSEQQKAGKHRKRETEAQTGLLKPKEAEALLKDTRSGDADKKLGAITQLSANADPTDPSVAKALEEMLADDDPSVRAQAVFGLSRLGTAQSIGMLQNALQDSEPQVRHMAVDSITPDAAGIPLLRAALNDQDEAVRSLASFKLGLANNGGLGPEAGEQPR